MSDWKDDYREQKQESDKTWDEFVQTELHHEDELDDLRAQVDQLTEDVTELSKHVRELRNNIGEVLILAQHERDE
jgi:polyhydroxyalkanoate synthesis regulator phasin